MNVLKNGLNYKVYGDDLIVLKNLPVNTYKINFSKFEGFFLTATNELEINEDKIYGVHEKKVEKTLKRFEHARKNLGVILSGDKGIGKSLFARILAKRAIEQEIPVIICSEYISGLENFINSIETTVMILFDEFDKTFKKIGNTNPQDYMLSVFDGLSVGKKLFVITCNEYRTLNEFLINRPGRFHFHFRFEYPTAKEIKEYMMDKLKPEYHSEIKDIISFSRRRKLNYDCLSAIVMEINDGETFKSAIKDLNIIDEEYKTFYTIKLIAENGEIFTNKDVSLDLLDTTYESDTIWLVGKRGFEDIGIKVCTSDLVETQFGFMIRPEDLIIKFYEEPCDKDEMERVKALKFDRAEITLNKGKNIHYML